MSMKHVFGRGVDNSNTNNVARPMGYNRAIAMDSETNNPNTIEINGNANQVLNIIFNLITGGDVNLQDLQNALMGQDSTNNNRSNNTQSDNETPTTDSNNVYGDDNNTSQDNDTSLVSYRTERDDNQDNGTSTTGHCGGTMQTPDTEQPTKPAYPTVKTPVYTPVTRKTTGGDKSTVYGDPHFTGFDGEIYDVQGERGKFYNIISDKGLQYNAKFDKWGNEGANVISQAGLHIGADKVTFDPRAQQAFVETGDGQKIDLMSGETFERDGNTVKWNNDTKTLEVHTEEYDMNLRAMEWGKMDTDGTPSTYIDNDISITSAGTMGDGVASHGLLGQTADGEGLLGTLNGFNGDNATRKGDTGAGAQGGGVIERIVNGKVVVTSANDVDGVNDYLENDLFSTTSAFSRYGVDPNDMTPNNQAKFTRTNGDILLADGQIIFRAAPVDKTANKNAATDGAVA